MSTYIKKVLCFLFIIFSLSACSFKLDKPASEKKISVSLDFLNSATRLNGSPTLQAIATPSTTDDFQCFVAKVTGPGFFEGSGVQDKSCTMSVGVIPGQISRFFRRGENVKFQISEKSNATVEIYGIYPAPVECGGTSAAVNGYILGSRTLTVTDNQNLTVPVSYNSAIPKQLTCIPNNINLAEANIFGNGSDGDVVLPSIVSSPSTTLNPVTGRYYSAYFRVMSIGADKRSLMLSSAPTSLDLQPGDEILLYTTASSGNTDCDSETKYGPGNFSFLNVASVSGSTVTTVQTLDPTTVFNNANLSIGLPQVFPNAFCSMQIRRVPQFNNLDLVSYSFMVEAYNNSTALGGVLAIKVKGTLTGTATGKFDASGKGAQAGASNFSGAGRGHPPRGAFTGDNSGGGGTQTGGAGGSGGGINGGNGGNNSGATGGFAASCTGVDCLFIGGSGGTGTSGSGGHGGGILVVNAKQINMTSTAAFDVRASNPSGSFGGGGGGGGVYIKTQEWLSSGQIQAGGSTGDTGGGSPGGGGGGGGSVFFRSCTGNLPTIFTASGSGGTGTPNGFSGSMGNVNTQIDPNQAMCFYGL